ncbi:MAG TPA: cobalamin biosynthesis protein CbiD [Acidaminococcaceae bacterium]|nr:cobalamin biosynthesis protein CbiD [Acidaminococcaceae bacterium]
MEQDVVVSQGKLMRRGYTTGSCAAAASKAAAVMLLSGEETDSIRLDTPKGISLTLDVLDILRGPGFVRCAIRKDSGDDPDDTNGTLIYATVSDKNSKIPGEEPVMQPQTPSVEQLDEKVEIWGGIGVGKVTKPGLACKVGGPAINPVPRKMITQEVLAAMDRYGFEGTLRVVISIPDGAAIAPKTFNPRLGIEGGISVLGTSGIVEPMSDRALIDTMYTEMNSRKAAGCKDLLVFFGNYGADFTRDEMKIDISTAVTCSNFVGELLDYAVLKGFESVLIIGHSGKLIKLAQGVMNTHSKYADCRSEFLALQALFHGADPEVGKEIYQALTTDEMTKILKREGLFETVMEEAVKKIDFYMQKRVHGKVKTGAILFSNVYGLLGKTANADQLLKLHQNDAAKNNRGI